MSGRDELTERILGTLARRHSTATVLFHHAVAERLGLGPTDHKCLDLVVEHQTVTGSELAAMTGLTSGAVTGVVNRLEQAGYIRREPDPEDGRRQLLRPVPERFGEAERLFKGIAVSAAGLLDGFDDQQLEAIATFLTRSTEFARERAAVLRAEVLGRGGRTRKTQGEP
ncbi:MarR family winged helix-turn-helix transcriptional regulator [Occultella gossypii]|uniref:MarR family transcriptional regulator n=1 Tax=Occultella gossypii TaxID=2800820 RepID=A0ABS7SDK1_9MICO|nr:MarR family transcriptional regulator [Occultella gossypii]MBZ2198426.1 MarR family transcriptional regulator [Occultella gossypii]